MDDSMDDFLKEKFQAKHGAMVRRAMALIEPAAARREDCLIAVEIAIVDIGYFNGQQRRPQFKAAKLAAKRLALALVRIENVLKDENLPRFVHHYFPNAAISEWRIEMEKFAAAKAPVKPSRKVATAKAPVKPKDRAVSAALSLMHYSSAPDTAKGRRFCKLAALLYGEANANLVKQCKDARRGRSPRWGWR